MKTRKERRSRAKKQTTEAYAIPGVCTPAQEPDPHFRNKGEEAEFWVTHTLGELWDQLEPVEIKVAPKARRITLRPSHKKPVTLRLKEQQITQAKQLARQRSLSYQALMWSWISEGIERGERPRRRGQVSR